MWWLIGVIIIIAAFAFPRFGKALLILAGVVGAAIALFAVNERQEDAAAKTRMLPQEVELSELTLAFDYGSSYRLAGRIKNRSSRYTLTSFEIQMTVRDCSAQRECETVGDKTAHVYASVPPGQSRGLDEHVYFSALPRFKGRFEWSYSVAGVRAK